MKDKLTKENILRAKELFSKNDVPKNLGLICPHCNGHIKGGDLLNSVYHSEECYVKRLRMDCK